LTVDTSRFPRAPRKANEEHSPIELPALPARDKSISSIDYRKKKRKKPFSRRGRKAPFNLERGGEFGASCSFDSSKND
jgi:hypothetical protein